MNMLPSERPRWAPRVPKDKIRRLYVSAAGDRLDEELVEDVGLMLYLRCRDILTVEGVKQGKVPCPRCGQILFRPSSKPELLLTCTCGWEMSYRNYRKSFSRKQMNIGGALEAFQRFVDGYARTETVRERLLLIDRLIHAFHIYLVDWLQEKRRFRPVCVQLIEGNLTDVVAFLDQLGYGDYPPELCETKVDWRHAFEEQNEYLALQRAYLQAKRPRDGD